MLVLSLLNLEYIELKVFLEEDKEPKDVPLVNLTVHENGVH